MIMTDNCSYLDVEEDVWTLIRATGRIEIARLREIQSCAAWKQRGLLIFATGRET